MSERELRANIIDLVDKAQTQIPAGATPEEVAQCFGLQIRLGDLPNGEDGAYLEDSKTIVISQVVTSGERRNFTFYHELVHHLIRQEDQLYSYIHETYSKPRQFEGVIELLCNIGAAELLVPHEQVRTLIDEEGFTLRHLPRLCTDRNASGPATLIQLIQCAPHRCYGVVCDFGYPPLSMAQSQRTFVQQTTTPRLYILYATWSPSAQYSISRFTIIPEDHILFQAFRGQEHLRGDDRIPFRSGKVWKVQSEAMFFRGKCYGIFNVGDPPNPNQPHLF